MVTNLVEIEDFIGFAESKAGEVSVCSRCAHLLRSGGAPIASRVYDTGFPLGNAGLVPAASVSLSAAQFEIVIPPI